MATYKCRKCGADLTPQADGVTAVCEYCDSVLRLPKVDSELFNRAIELRRQRKFDQAAALFRQCVSQNPQDPESHWNLLLCRFGVEYVEEKDGTRIPTCNGITYDPITEDEDYLDAIRFADELSARMYAEEAARITAIQQEIIRLASQGESYDVFISYKESDEQGARTEDSVLAQEVYDALTKKGYKVFLSRITLKGQAGLKYEPIIFSALNSAPVMLLVGTSTERMESVWVSNEWKRFLHLMEEDKEKKLEVIYKGMKRIDLPARLRFMPQRDITAAGRFGWQQDVSYDVDSMIGSRKKQAAPEVSYIRETDEEVNERTIRNLYMRSEQVLEQTRNKEDACKFLEQALDIDDQRTETWWRLLDLKSDHLYAPNGVKPHPSDEIQELMEKVCDCARQDIPQEQEWKDAVDAYALAWEHAYGLSRFKMLKEAVACQNRYSESNQTAIPTYHRAVQSYAEASLAAQGKQLYDYWAAELPEFKKALKLMDDRSGLLAVMRKQNSGLDETFNKLEKSQARYRKGCRRPVPFTFLNAVYALYLAIAPIIMVFFTDNEEAVVTTGVYSLGSIILFALYILGTLILFNGDFSGGNFTLSNGLSCIFLLISPVAGLLFRTFKIPMTKLQGALYGVELHIEKDGSSITYYVSEFTELMTKSQAFLSKFLVVLLVFAIFSILASIFLCIRMSSLDKQYDKMCAQLQDAKSTVYHATSAFCKPYQDRFGSKSFDVQWISRNVENLMYERYGVKRRYD